VLNVPAQKTPAAKSAPKKAAKSVLAAAKKPLHPYKINGQSWNKDKVMDIVCAKIACCTLGIGTILKAGHDGNTLPGYVTIAEWLVEDVALAERYATAKAAQAEYMAEELLEIADDGRNDYMEKMDAKGQSLGYAINGENANRSRLRIDTRKWLLGKLKPKKYGEKFQVGGAEDLPPIQTQSTVDIKSLNLSKEELTALKAIKEKIEGAASEG